MRKKDINEIIDADNNLIGSDDKPTAGANLDTMANNTTDYNRNAHAQNYKNDFMGLYGYWGAMWESEEGESSLNDKIAKIMYSKYLQTLEYYHKNPDKLRSDYEKHMGDKPDFNKNKKDVDYKWAEKVMKLINGDDKSQIDENMTLKEDIVEPKDSNKPLEKKDDDNELTAKAKKVADLIDKLPHSDKEKIKNILEQ